MLEVRIASLKPGLHSFLLHPSPEDVGLDPAEFSDIEVEVRLDYDPDRVYVMLTARAVATLMCDRTLVLFEEEIEGQHATLFVSDASLASSSEEDVVILPTDAVTVDVADTVRDTLVLALPVRRVAPGAEEAPIQTHFGALLDSDGHVIDPRWEALRKLHDKS